MLVNTTIGSQALVNTTIGSQALVNTTIGSQALVNTTIGSHALVNRGAANMVLVSGMDPIERVRELGKTPSGQEPARRLQVNAEDKRNIFRSR